MKALIAATLAGGLVFAASPTFAQAPPPAGFPAPQTTPPTSTTPGTPPAGFGTGSANHPEGKGEGHEKWEDCMARQEAKYGGVKTVGQHAGGNGGGKGNWKANSKGKPEPPNEKTEAKQGEKENRHQAEMNDCREQLYGRDTPPAGKK